MTRAETSLLIAILTLGAIGFAVADNLTAALITAAIIVLLPAPTDA